MPTLDPGDRCSENAAAPLCLRQVEERLAAKFLGCRLLYFEQIDSTNNYAKILAEQGEPQGTIVIAEQQTLGRGRLGRRWESPPFVNLYCSVILRPTLAPPEAPWVTLTAAVALAEAIESFSPVAPTIKWPNDILAGGKKLAGVLTEAVSTAERLEFVILGIGVNVNFSRESMPPELRDRATSLAVLAGAKISREDFLGRLIHHLDRCYGILEAAGFEAIAADWDKRFNLRGRAVRVAMTDRTIVGRAVGLDRDGALIVETDDRRERIVAGDVIPVEE